MSNSKVMMQCLGDATPAKTAKPEKYTANAKFEFMNVIVDCGPGEGGRMLVPIYQLCQKGALGIAANRQKSKLREKGWSNNLLLRRSDGKTTTCSAIYVDDVPQWISEIEENRIPLARKIELAPMIEKFRAAVTKASRTIMAPPSKELAASSQTDLQKYASTSDIVEAIDRRLDARLDRMEERWQEFLKTFATTVLQPYVERQEKQEARLVEQEAKLTKLDGVRTRDLNDIQALRTRVNMLDGEISRSRNRKEPAPGNFVSTNRASVLRYCRDQKIEVTEEEVLQAESDLRRQCDSSDVGMLAEHHWDDIGDKKFRPTFPYGMLYWYFAHNFRRTKLDLYDYLPTDVRAQAFRKQ